MLRNKKNRSNGACFSGFKSISLPSTLNRSSTISMRRTQSSVSPSMKFAFPFFEDHFNPLILMFFDESLPFCISFQIIEKSDGLAPYIAPQWQSQYLRCLARIERLFSVPYQLIVQVKAHHHQRRMAIHARKNPCIGFHNV